MKRSESESVLQRISDILAEVVPPTSERRNPPASRREKVRTGQASEDRFARRKSERPEDKANKRLRSSDEMHLCSTDHKGYATPKNMSPFDLVLHSPDGFIPLWAPGVTLRWRFDESSLEGFEDPEDTKEGVRELMTEAISAWGEASPIRFTEESDAWDFEVSLRESDSCGIYGCTLAQAFFPDAGRHQLVLYPKMFTQSHKEQVDTLIHEFGHVFGLRHFFAQISETDWPSEIFGVHKPFTIMNYGVYSELTEDDKNDLKSLYEGVWSGQITSVNGTPIRIVTPYHSSGSVVWPRVTATAVRACSGAG